MSVHYNIYTIIPEIQSLSMHLSAFNGAYKTQRRMDRLFLILILGMLVAILFALIVMILAVRYSLAKEDGNTNITVFLLVGVALLGLELYQWYKVTRKEYRLREMLVTDVNYDNHFGKTRTEGVIPESLLVDIKGRVITQDSYVRIDKSAYVLVGEYCLFQTSMGFILYTKTKEKVHINRDRGKEDANKNV